MRQLVARRIPTLRHAITNIRAAPTDLLTLEQKDGTGLGLWISRNIVERYGGDIRVRSRDEGRRGAVFAVLLK